MTSPPSSASTPQTLPHPRWTNYDTYLFKRGEHRALGDRLGSHPTVLDGTAGVHFAVYAPHADAVHVIGDFNDWRADTHPLFKRWDESGIWEGFIPEVTVGTYYKYAITKQGVDLQDKIDPMARAFEHPPKTASKIHIDAYDWQDTDWISQRATWSFKHEPLSIYEMHLGSWRRKSDDEPFSYTELIELLPPYLVEMGFTHVEITPIMEYPYDPSWGYQALGYYAPTSRYGTPEELKALIDALHQAGVGVLLDWVPSHFPGDAHGLANYDGAAVYEHPDPSRGYHPDWDSMIFDYGKPEVRSFLISSALHWIAHFHIDGIRVDAVASMLYLDYSREEGQWQPNDDGGNTNKEAVAFLQELNNAIHDAHPGVISIAEESTAYEGVTRSVADGGLGFDMKWMMGWMHDTLTYFGTDPLFRYHQHSQITFSMYYAFSEHFLLPLSHDEVVHGKKSILGRMPGDEQGRFAQLRALYTYMMAHPGGKLLFMGSEWGSYDEWAFDKELPWSVLDYPVHQGIQRLVSDLNHLYREIRALHEMSYQTEGFLWMDYEDAAHSVITYARFANDPDRCVIAVHNFVPVRHEGYLIKLPYAGEARLLISSESSSYGGLKSMEDINRASFSSTNHMGTSHLEYDLDGMEGALFLLVRSAASEEE